MNIIIFSFCFVNNYKERGDPMDMKEILREATEYSETMKNIRCRLHENAEVGFELQKTSAIVTGELKKLGYRPMPCGKGILATIGNGGGAVLLRADMDALPIKEESALPFAAKNGNMHACGHDMHTAMLLGAAKILKDHESELTAPVKLMFQPAEEILEGAKNMIAGGVLENPKVEKAMMIHVATALEIPSGSIIIPEAGVGAPSADHIKTEIFGRSCHGSTPSLGIDANTAAAHALVGLSEIISKELSLTERAVLTFGKICGGTAPNVISDRATIEGTLKAFDEETRVRIKERIKEICEHTAKAHRAEAKISFEHGCPSLKNDEQVLAEIKKFSEKMLGKENVIFASSFGSKTVGGSEDFAYVAKKVPSAVISLAAGEKSKGYIFPLHHPKTDFDPSVLPIGAAILAGFALQKN